METAEFNDGFTQAGYVVAILVQQDSGDISNQLVTVSAIGGPIDYSSHSDAWKAEFESLIGTTSIGLVDGSNFSGISVQGVPEPTSFALFSIALVGMARRRRQRQSIDLEGNLGGS